MSPCHMSVLRNTPCLVTYFYSHVNIGSMSHVGFKKWLCRCVKFKRQGPFYCCMGVVFFSPDSPDILGHLQSKGKQDVDKQNLSVTMATHQNPPSWFFYRFSSILVRLRERLHYVSENTLQAHLCSPGRGIGLLVYE